ncbi:MAG: PQQ-binding-like beta-propeller repeat protein [Deltaproteobacteria bacterium]|nr:PQQ-binding-like beta-propeller repeat protein [Deltaproteobacteria bacterium]
MRTVLLVAMFVGALGACKSDSSKTKAHAPTRGLPLKGAKPVPVPTADLGDELKRPFADKTGKLGDDYQYPMSKVLWERPMKVDVSHKDAFDAKRGILYGTDASHTRVQAIDINTGRIVWTGSADLTKPPKKFDPDKHPKKANDQSLEPNFQILGAKVFVAQNVIKGDAKKGDLVVKIHGYEAASGRRIFTASMPNTWGEGKSWAIWKEVGALLLGDSGDGPVHIIDQAKGKPRHTFNFPAEGSGKWVYAGGGSGNIYFYQDRGTGTLGFAAFDAETGAARWLSAILQECYNDPMYLRQVVASTIVCKWKGRGHNVADRVIQFDAATGQAKWATLVFEAGAMSKEAKYASNVVVRASADRSALFFRNLHTLVRLDAPSGKEGWRRKLDPERHVLFLVDGKPWKTEIVQAGEFTYDEVVALDAAGGKELWKVTTPGKEQALPGHIIWQKGKLVLFGDFRVYAYDAATGKALLAMENRFAVGAREAKTKVDSVSLLGDVVVVAASGVRTAYELGSAKKVLHEPSNDETSLNWNLDLDRANLVIFDDDDFVVRALAISGGAAPKVQPPVAKFLTPAAANAVAPRFSPTGDRVGFTSDSFAACVWRCEMESRG